MAPATVISVEGVSVRQGGRRILEDIDWSVGAGEHWALVGANGSGKTTLLKVLTGYLWPSRGEVEVLGERFGQVDLRDLRRQIGWVSVSLGEQVALHHGDDAALAVVASGRDASIGLYRPVGEAVFAEARSLLAWIGGEALVDRPFGVLSQGERQRVLLARAWMGHPRLLILDEPASGLDLVARETLLAGLSRLVTESSDAPSVLYVTHHIDEILPWFTHAIVLKDGRMAGRGPKEDTLTDAVLSAAFGVAVEVVWRSGRPWLTLAESGAHRRSGSR